MVLWLLTLLLSPTPSPAHAVLGLAVVAAALLILLAARSLTASAQPQPGLTPSHGAGPEAAPRLRDPDAAGRPRPRAPSTCPTAA